jgi:hypothetical protein
VVITRLVAENDPAWEAKMQGEADRGKNLLANAAMLKSRAALAELTLTQDVTVMRQ